MKIFKNKGYSFVELLIVMALVGILATMSLVSLTLLNTARAKQASTVFGDEVNSVRKKAMNMTPDNAGDRRYGMVLYYDSDDRFKVVEVPCDYTAPNFIYDLSAAGEVVPLSKRAEVKFTGYYQSLNDGSEPNGDGKVSDYTAGALNSTDSVCIMFDKKGNCISGYGEYDFYKTKGNRVARVFIKQNGSIEIR